MASMIFKALKSLFNGNPSNSSVDTSNTSDKRYYVYVHETTSGEVFYVGKGTGKRAWVKDRDIHWNNYVENYLNNEYQVRIVYDDLSEEEAFEKESDLMSHYGDQLLNRQNMSRRLDVKALDNRNSLMRKSEILALKAELEDNVNEKASLLIKALNYYNQSAKVVFEKGLFGKLSAERPIGNIQLLEKTIRALIASQRKQEAEMIFEQYFSNYPQDKELKSVASISKVIERGTVKLQAQEDFTPPKDLPLDWIYSADTLTPRLDPQLYLSKTSNSFEVGELDRLAKSDLSEALTYIKRWIVREEHTKYKDPSDRNLWLYVKARKTAKKNKDLLEECLFQNLYVKELEKSGDEKRYLENLIILRKLSAKLSRNPQEKLQG